MACNYLNAVTLSIENLLQQFNCPEIVCVRTFYSNVFGNNLS